MPKQKLKNHLAFPWQVRVVGRVAISLLVLASLGCSSGGQTAEFQQIAGLGKDYTRALDGTLVQTGRLAVQAGSFEMLADRELVAPGPEDLAKRDHELKVFLNELVLLREQTMALHDYFHALGALAGSKAPAQLAAGLNQSANALASISGTVDEKLGTGRYAEVGSRAAAGAALGAVVIERRRMEELRSELEKRHGIVDRVLVLHQELIAVLKGIAEDDQELVGQMTYDANVIAPFVGSTGPLPCPPLWMADREAALMAGAIGGQMDLVSQAADALRSAWKKLLDNRLSGSDLPLLAKSVGDALVGPVGLQPSPPPAYWHCPQLVGAQGDQP